MEVIHTKMDEQRLYARFQRLMEQSRTDDEFTWRMEGMIRWWLGQMIRSCNGDDVRVVAALTRALNDMGITTIAAVAPSKPSESASVN